jgi:predicted dienelactone hydrolase
MVTSRAVRRWLLSAVVTAALLAAGCASDGKKAASPPTPAAAGDHTTSTTAPTTTTLDPGEPTKPAARYGVGSRTIHLVDTSRPTKASPTRNIPAANSRSFDVLVLYPTADASGGTAPVEGAPVADGRFPLLEFSHGVTANGPVYTPFLAPIARAGYVVAAPTFPLTSGRGAWTDLTDYVNQPADVSFIIDQLLVLDRTAADPLHGHLAAKAIAVGGHSLGALTTFGFDNTCCADRRVKATIAISGVEPSYPGGTYEPAPKDLPTLLIHGTNDITVPYRGSVQAFGRLAAPRALLTFPGGSHTDPVASPKDAPIAEQTIVAFLALHLRHDDTAWKALAPKTPASTLQVAGGLAAPAG